MTNASSPHTSPTDDSSTNASSADASPASESHPSVARNDDESRYEIHVDGQLAGFVEFSAEDDGRLVFPRTEIDKAYSGQGLGKTLVADALADAARRGETVVPVCPFVVKYVKDNDVAGLIVDWPDDDDAQTAATSGEQSS